MNKPDITYILKSPVPDIFDKLVQFPCVQARLQPRKDTGHFWLIQHVWHLTADVKGPEPPEEKEPAVFSLLMHER